jgi:hypothetical protein
MEGFEDGALVLRLTDRHLVELNATAHFILARTDGRQDVARVAAAVAEAFEIPPAEAAQDTLALYGRLAEQGIVEPVVSHQEEEETFIVEKASDDSPRYMRNPDVVLREEDPDEGGLLFNPDTNQVKVLNTTGLFIWQQCQDGHTLDQIAAAVQTGFEDAPADAVAGDVKEFVEGMVESGFIGTVEDLG